MTQSFNCPNCGAALEYNGSSRTMQCPYCGTTVPVPEEFWREVEVTQTVNQWRKYVIIFLIITVGLPTCVGLGGALIGVLAPIFAIVLSFIIQFFVH